MLFKFQLSFTDFNTFIWCRSVTSSADRHDHRVSFILPLHTRCGQDGGCVHLTCSVFLLAFFLHFLSPLPLMDAPVITSFNQLCVLMVEPGVVGGSQSDRGDVGTCVSVVSCVSMSVCMWLDCILCCTMAELTLNVISATIAFAVGGAVYLHHSLLTYPLMSWSSIVPKPNLLLQSQQILAPFCSVSSSEMGCEAQKDPECNLPNCQMLWSKMAPREPAWIHSVSGPRLQLQTQCHCCLPVIFTPFVFIQHNVGLLILCCCHL